MRNLKLAARRAASELRAALTWWTEELREMGESVLGRLFPHLITKLLVTFDSDQVGVYECRGGQRQQVGRFALDSVELGARAGSKQTILAVPMAQVLVIRLTLPGLLERDLEGVVALQLERDLPIPTEKILIDRRVVARNKATRKMDVEVYVMHRKRVDELLALASGWGLEVFRVGVIASNGELTGNFLRHQDTSELLQLDGRERRLTIAAAGLTLLLGAVIAGQWLYERWTVGRQLSQVHAVAMAADRAEQRLKQDAVITRRMIRLMQQPDALDRVNDLTRLLPADVWLSEIELTAAPFEKNHLKAMGFAPAATAMIETLQAAKQFEAVKLIASTPTGLGAASDRVELSATYRAEPNNP